MIRTSPPWQPSDRAPWRRSYLYDPPLPESTDRTRKTVLPNGIRVVTEHMPHVRSVTMGVWVWSGTRFEPAEKPGIAHFLEHAVFKGTEKRNAYQIAQSIESLGGYLNAFTGRELNCYFARVMDSHLPVAVDVIGDLLQSSKFDPQEIEKEKMVVIEEIHGLEDNPEDLVSELYANLIWQPHPLSRPILGNAPSVSSFTRNHLVAYLKDRYRNDHIYVIAAGSVDHEALVDLVREQYDFTGESHQADTDVDTAVDTGVDTSVLLDSERHKQRRRMRVLSKDIAQAHLCLGGVALPYGHPSKYALFLLNALLGGGMTSRLFQKIREEAGLAYSIYSDLDFYRDTGQICISAGVDPKDAQRAVDLIRQECRVLCEQPVPEEELRDTRSQLTGSLYLSLEESGSVMNRLARAEIYENTHVSVDETVRKLEEVTTVDIAELAGTVFTAENTYLTAVGPLSVDDIAL
ncbi:MAG: insulinase family protein [Gemmatimonadetes bacterium]|nr:insulinase family protein [Gemmatimonadota bacterium]MYA78602.1 insulinase family protein [Gemmatimonadota bacterium]MYG17361.1 insulinase family protein [Gemmatimonadota bacterium]MYH17579.1 insulinase family protein [Gemmatimonadota bacterium]